MAQAFNLVARLQLQGPKDVTQIVNRIQSKLNNIKANVALNIPTNTGSQLKKFNTSITNTNNLLKNLTTNAQAASTALNAVATGMQTTGVKASRVNKAAGTASQNMKSIATNSKVAATEMAEFGRVSALAVRRFLAFSIPAGLLIGLVTSIKQGVRAAIDFEREMIRVQQVTGKTAEALTGLTNEIGRLSTTFGVASSELVGISRTLAQAGLSANETKIALSAIAKTDLSPTFDSMKQTTEGAIAAMRQFGIEAGMLESKLGSMNAVAGAFAVESADIISAIRRTGGAFQAAGGNLEELIALFTSVRSTTRESADSIATGFRTIFTRLQRPRTIKFLQDFGVELQDLDGKFVGPFEAVKQLSFALKNLDPRDVRFSRITEELGGFRQVSKVIPLIQQFAVSQKALATATAGTESIAEDAAIAQNALAVQFSKVREEFIKLAREVVGSDLFKSLAKFALQFASSLVTVLRQLKPIIPLLTGLAAFKGISVARQFGGGFLGGLGGGGGKGSITTKANTQAQTKNTTITNINTKSLDNSAVQTQRNDKTVRGNSTVLAQLNKTMVSLIQSINNLATAMRFNRAAASRPRGFASGGLVGGVGSGDTVPAMLTPGEFVINKKTAQTIGQGRLNNLNRVQHFANGGVVKSGNVGSGAGGGLLTIGILSTFAGTLVEADSAMASLLNVVTTLAFSFEGIRAILGTMQSFGQQVGVGRGRAGLPSRNRAILFGRDRAGRGAGRFTGGRLSLRSGSRIDTVSKNLTGLGVSTLAFTGIIAAASTALIYFSQQATAAAEATASNARSTQEMEKSFDEARESTILFDQGVGIGGGAAAGALIGSVVPVVGTAIGAVAGAIVGGIGGAISGHVRNISTEVKRLRSINRRARGEEVSTSLSANLQRLSSGNIDVVGSSELAEIGPLLQKQLVLLNEARAGGNRSEIISSKKAITSNLSALTNLKDSILDSVTSIREFKSSVNSGSSIIDQLSVAYKQSTREISRNISKEILVRNKINAKREDAAASLVEFDNSLGVLRDFGDSLSNMVSKLNDFGNQLSVSSALAEGKTAFGQFTGGPGFGRFSQIGTSGIGNSSQFNSSLDQALGGFGGQSASGQAVLNRTKDLAIILDEVPGILSDIARSGAQLDGADISRRFEEQAKEQFRGLIGSDDLINILTQGIRTKTTGEGGKLGEFLAQIRSDARSVLPDIGGSGPLAIFDKFEEIGTNMLAAVSQFDSALKTRLNIELQITDRRLKVLQQNFQAEETLFNARNRGTGKLFGGAGAAKGAQVSGLLSGTKAFSRTRTIDPFDVNIIGGKLRELSNEIEKETTARQESKTFAEEATASGERLEALNLEAEKLRKALQLLGDVTTEAADIQKTLNSLEEGKKARFGVAEQFTFGTRADRQKLLQSIADTVKVTSGQLTVDQIPEGRRAGVNNLLKRFENIITPLAGLDKEGKSRTGGAARRAAIIGRIGSIPAGPAAGFVGGPKLSVADSDPSKRNVAEQNAIAKLDALFERRKAVETQFIASLKDRDTSLVTKMETALNDFATGVTKQLNIVQRVSLERRLGTAKAQRGLLEGQQGQVSNLQTAIGPFTNKGSINELAAIRTAQAFSTKSSAVTNLKNLRAGTRFVRDVTRSGDFGQDTVRTGRFGNISVGGVEEFSTRSNVRGQFQDIFNKAKRSKTIDTQKIGADIKDSGFLSFLESQGVLDKDSESELQNKIAEKIAKAVGTKGKQDDRDIQGHITQLILTTINKRVSDQMKELRAAAQGGLDDSDSSQVFGLIEKEGLTLKSVGAELSKLNSESLSGLPDKIKELRKEISRLEFDLSKFNADGTKKAVNKAFGGTIFKRQGTDTVPAMLTPGEFVVNQAATQRNMGLLKQINGGSNPNINDGTSYARRGGKITREEFLQRQQDRRDKFAREHPGQARLGRSSSSSGGASFGGITIFNRGGRSGLESIQDRIAKSKERTQNILNPGLFSRASDFSPSQKKSALEQEAIILKRLESQIQRFKDRGVPKFHNGGMVPGTGDKAAILQGGEFVLSKPAVQGLARGGVVKGYQGGGSVSGGGSGTITLSSESIAALNSLTESSAQLASSAQIMNEASISFQAGAVTMQEGLQALPAEISTALNEASVNLESSSTTLGESVTGLSTATTGFTDGVAQLAAVVTSLATATEGMKGAATEIRDALAQEIQINVTHTHEPITVTVEGGETTITAGGDGFSEKVMEVVGPELDSVVSRLREIGFGIA